LSVECHCEDLAKHRPVILVERFPLLLELSEAFGNKEVAT
jgi:hypothetical protein